MADFIVRFNDWSGGDYGVGDPAKAQTNQFAGTNVMEYDSGLLGVRPGWRRMNVTGLPNHPQVPSPNGFDHWNGDLVVTIDNQTYRVPILDKADTATTAVALPVYSTTSTAPVHYTEAVQNLYVTHDFNLYRHSRDADNTIPVSIPTNAKFRQITRWNYRLVAVDDDSPFRIWYSDVTQAGPDWDSWPAINFLDIPGNEPIVCLIPWYNVLLVGKRSGWWQVSGNIADRPFVRQITRGNGPTSSRAIASTTDNRAFHWGVEPTPTWFNGENTYLDRGFRLRGFQTSYPCHTVVAAPTGRKLFMLAEPSDTFDQSTAATSMLMQRQNDWTIHTFNAPFAGICPSDVRHGADMPSHTIFGVERPNVIGTPIYINSWQHTLSRPGRHDDNWVDATDPGDTIHVTGSFDTHAFYDAQSRMVQVRSVVIQFRKWDCGGTGCLNELHVEIRPLGRYEGGTQNTKPLLWSEPAKRASATGTDDSVRMGFGDQGFANGFQVVIPKMRGVAIRSIEAHVRLRGDRL